MSCSGVAPYSHQSLPRRQHQTRIGSHLHTLHAALCLHQQSSLPCQTTHPRSAEKKLLCHLSLPFELALYRVFN
jgi:hypothetical protein